MCPSAKDAPSSKLSRFGFFLSIEFSSVWEARSTSSCFLLLPEALMVSDVGIFRELGPASGRRALVDVVPESRCVERARPKSGSKTAVDCDRDGGNEELLSGELSSKSKCASLLCCETGLV
jgi:hypothetical protein